jgi:hypothetical protein
VSIATILKWKEAGLLQRPTVTTARQGRGSLVGWPWTEYRRLLRIACRNRCRDGSRPRTCGDGDQLVEGKIAKLMAEFEWKAKHQPQ